MLTFAYIFYFAFMEFRTKTLIPTPKWHIHHADKLMVMGSCFAEHIGNRLHQMKFRCDLNPFGVLYNPLSIAEALRQLIAQHMYTESELIEFPDGGWSTWLHHSRFSQPDRATALSGINDRISCASHILKGNLMDLQASLNEQNRRQLPQTARQTFHSRTAYRIPNHRDLHRAVRSALATTSRTKNHIHRQSSTTP